MDTLNEDAFDVGCFRGAGDPDDVRIIRHRRERIFDGTMDAILAEHSNMDPWRQRGETVRGGFVGEDDRAGFRDAPAADVNAASIWST